MVALVYNDGIRWQENAVKQNRLRHGQNVRMRRKAQRVSPIAIFQSTWPVS